MKDIDILWLFLGTFGAVFGFALLFAGGMILALPTEEERAAQRWALKLARAKGWWQGELFAAGQVLNARNRAFVSAATHWRERSLGRRLSYGGVFSFAVAIAAGFLSGLFGP